ncbi:MAG: hypothetical protein E7051_06865 [Lentisphaerae bacterium]|nr:hypothetical protein [Lentisphaerota bacterium]
MKKSKKILLTAALTTASVVMAGLYVYCEFLLAPPVGRGGGTSAATLAVICIIAIVKVCRK